MAIVAGTVLYASSVDMNLPGIDQGYAPRQPIAFSHKLHGGELRIPCQYCHSGAEKSRHAGIPSPSVCMNCHRFVTGASNAPKLEGNAAPVSEALKNLYDAVGYDPQKKEWDEKRAGKPIEWIRVHNLPDFVHFDHRPHVHAGVGCEQCHGPVGTMEKIVQWSDLSMGWCVNCHRDVNKGQIVDLHGKTVSTDCSVCHY